MQKKFELDEFEYDEFVFLKSMQKKLTEIEQIAKYFTITCNKCSHDWNDHEYSTHLYCNLCKSVCTTDF